MEYHDNKSIPKVRDLTTLPYTITLDDDPIPARIIEETLGLKKLLVLRIVSNSKTMHLNSNQKVLLSISTSKGNAASTLCRRFVRCGPRQRSLL